MSTARNKSWYLCCASASTKRLLVKISLGPVVTKKKSRSSLSLFHGNELNPSPPKLKRIIVADCGKSKADLAWSRVKLERRVIHGISFRLRNMLISQG